MFDWIDTQLAKLKGANRERKIRLAFSTFEAAKRAEHLQISLRKFPTGALEEEVHKLMGDVREEVRAKFAGPIVALENEVARVSAEIGHSKKELAILQHSYKSELEPLYEQLNVLSIETKAAQDGKQKSYADLEKAKERINSWHNKSKRSPFLSGNGGTELPRHSFFGQSLGDLDGYKADKSRASRDIARIRDQLAKLNARRSEIHQRVSVIKAARQRMFDLKEQGRSVNRLQLSLSRQQATLLELASRLAGLRTERGNALDAARYRTGAFEIERLILAIKLKRDDFVKSFDDPEVAAARFAAHVEDWINAHGS